MSSIIEGLIVERGSEEINKKFDYDPSFIKRSMFSRMANKEKIFHVCMNKTWSVFTQYGDN